MLVNDPSRKMFSNVSEAHIKAKLSQESSSLASLKSLMSQTSTLNSSSFGLTQNISTPSNLSKKLPDIHNTSAQLYQSELRSFVFTGSRTSKNDNPASQNLIFSQFSSDKPSFAKFVNVTQANSMNSLATGPKVLPVRVEVPQKRSNQPHSLSATLQEKGEKKGKLESQSLNAKLFETRSKLFSFSDSPSEDETIQRRGNDLNKNERLNEFRPKLNKSHDFHENKSNSYLSQIDLDQDLPMKRGMRKGGQSEVNLRTKLTASEQLRLDSDGELMLSSEEAGLGSKDKKPLLTKQLSRKNIKNLNFSPEPLHKQEPEFYCHLRNLAYENNGPKGRSGATLAHYRDRVYLFGGETEGKLFGLAIYNPFKQSWKYPKVTGEIHNQERCGHSMNIIKNFFLIFGGEKIDDTGNKIRLKCTDEVLVFYPQIKQWNHINTQFFKSELIEPRKYHASCTYNHLLLVYGGIIDNGHLVNDFWSFDVEKCKWRRIPITNRESDERGIAYHRMCSIFQDTSDSNYNQRAKQIPEGFYVFGGKNDKGDALSTLKILAYDTSKAGLVWSVPTTKGNPPTGRYMHSMSHYKEGQMLIVYGGKTGGFKQKGKLEEASNSMIDDMCLLMLETMVWVKPSICEGQRLRSRFGHCSCIFTEKLFIFGGTTDDHFSDFYMENIELKKSEVERMKNAMDDSVGKITTRVGKAIQLIMTLNRVRSSSKKDEDSRADANPDSSYRKQRPESLFKKEYNKNENQFRPRSLYKHDKDGL